MLIPPLIQGRGSHASVRPLTSIRVAEDCVLDYEGTVQLADPKIEIGIPPHRWSYLVFVFANSSFLANRSGTITYETLLKPKPVFTMRSR